MFPKSGSPQMPYRQRIPAPLDCSHANGSSLVKLYSYFRSSAAYRVRIALNLKGISYEMVPIHLTKDGGRQHTPEYRTINPQAREPALVLPGGDVLTQSMAIIEYLDETHREPPLLPADAVGRAKVRAIAQAIACDIHPLNNLIALQYLRRQLKHEQAEIDAWYHTGSSRDLTPWKPCSVPALTHAEPRLRLLTSVWSRRLQMLAGLKSRSTNSRRSSRPMLPA